MLNTNRRLSLLCAFLICAITFAGASSLAFQKKEKPVQPGKPVIWQDPGEIEKLDFAGGPGG
ncbi:MAG: hypothetical protein ACREXT_06750, partial [Gammaproteobacteria bacterium]